MKKTKKLLIVILILILAVAIAIGVLYAVRPDIIDAFLQLFEKQEDLNGDKTPPAPPSGSEMQIHFIDVGQGDAIVLRFADGKDMIIDGGDKSAKSALIAYLKSIQIDYFDYLMLTHTDADHCGSLDDVLSEYEVRSIYMPKLGSSYGNDTLKGKAGYISTQAYNSFYVNAMNEKFVENGEEKNASINYNIGQFVIETTYAILNFYAPEESYYASIKDSSSAELKNGESPIGILEYAGRKVVLTGDAPDFVEEEFMQKTGKSEIDCDVLKAGHHGSRTSSSAAFLDFIKPEFAVISSKTGNSYGHPHDEVLSAYASRNMTVHRTDTEGSIVLTINAEGEMVFTDEKNPASTPQNASVGYTGQMIAVRIKVSVSYFF